MSRWFTGRQGRRTREALLAYCFLFPAFLIVGAFGLFPLLFAAYQSTLKGLNKVVGEYDGLANYVKAIANLTYVLFFWLAALLIFLSVRGVIVELRAARETCDLLIVPFGLREALTRLLNTSIQASCVLLLAEPGES
jgi:hypothetical protein